MALEFLMSYGSTISRFTKASAAFLGELKPLGEGRTANLAHWRGVLLDMNSTLLTLLRFCSVEQLLK